MPVTFDTRVPDKAVRGSKGAPAAPREEAIAQAMDAAEKKQGAVALVLWLAILAALCLPWWIWDATRPFAIGMPLWCALATLVFVVLAPRRVLDALRKDPKALVTAKHRGALKTVLGKVAPILAQPEPQAWVDATTPDASLRIFPGALVVNEPLFKQLGESEVNALAVRGVAHQKLGHARRLALIDAVRRLPSPLFKVLVWPVWIYASLLESMWLFHAEQSADRIALLIIRNHSLLLSAIVKQKAANDAAMQELGVTSGDVSNWVSQRGHIGMEGAEISTQYKLGRAIHENPAFERRVLNLQEWSLSKEFESAVEKLAKRK